MSNQTPNTEKMFNALESIISYDGHYEWLKEMRDGMEKLLESGDKYAYYTNPFNHTKWHTEEHTIYMLLVGMFGEWGTSIRGGWIVDLRGCIDFIDAICKRSWECEAEMEENE